MPNDRRAFLKSSVLAGAAALLPTSRVLGANERIRIGAIGTGGRCQYLMKVLNDVGGNEIVAVCDVYGPHRDKAREKYAPNAREYTDFRAVLEDKSIDAVVVGTPNHWHVPITIAAVGAGKDVYVEKPVTHTIAEGDPLEKAVTESKRIVQVGLQQRSWPHFQEAYSIVAGSQLGDITFIETHWYQNLLHLNDGVPQVDVSQLDWKQFVGDAPAQPFDALRFTNWRWFWDFGEGSLTDLFCHWVDVAQWYMGGDTPTTASALGGNYAIHRIECPDTISASFLYPGKYETVFRCSMIGYLEGGGLTFRGTKGLLRIDRNGYGFWPELPHYSEALDLVKPAQEAKTNGDGTPHHMKNFLDCVRSRAIPNAPVSVGISAARTAHFGNIAFRENRIVRVAG
jgi:predicted dehydrogenase